MTIIKRFLIIIGTIFLFALSIQTWPETPQNAMVYIDELSKEYFSPPCIVDNNIDTSGMPIIAISLADALSFKPNEKCREQSGFMGEMQSVLGMWLRKIGILKPKVSRWNSDGSWNW